jgi:hypothetical protein
MTCACINTPTFNPSHTHTPTHTHTHTHTHTSPTSHCAHHPASTPPLTATRTIPQVASGAVDPTRVYVGGWREGGFFAQMYGVARARDEGSAQPSGTCVAAVTVVAAGDPFSNITSDDETGFGAACELAPYEGPTLFVNSDTFVNTARLHTHVPLERSWYGSHQHGWCVRFERRAALLRVDPSSRVYAMFTLTFVFTNTHGPRYPSHGVPIHVTSTTCDASVCCNASQPHCTSTRSPGHDVAEWVCAARVKLSVPVTWNLLNGSDGTGRAEASCTTDTSACTAQVAQRNADTFPSHHESSMLDFLAAHVSDSGCWDRARGKRSVT